MVLCCTISPYLRYYPFNYRKDTDKKIRTVIIAPIDMVQTRPQGMSVEQLRWLEKELALYMQTNGYQTLPNDILQRLWNSETAAISGFFNPSNGKVDADKISTCLMRAIAKTRNEQAVDGVLFVQLVQRPAKLMGDRVYWDGGARRIYDENGNVTTGVSWSGEMSALSLQIQLFNSNHQIVFQSIGPVEFPFVYQSGFRERQFVWKKQFILDEDEIHEGIAIALHPLIPYAGYPKHPQFYTD